MLEDYRQLARQRGINPQLFESIVSQESSGNVNARNVTKKGDPVFGPLQITKPTFEWKGGKNFNDPAEVRDVATNYLAELHRKYNGDPTAVKTAWFSGEGNVGPDGKPKNPNASDGHTTVAQYVGKDAAPPLASAAPTEIRPNFDPFASAPAQRNSIYKYDYSMGAKQGPAPAGGGFLTETGKAFKRTLVSGNPKQAGGTVEMMGWLTGNDSMKQLGTNIQGWAASNDSKELEPRIATLQDAWDKSGSFGSFMGNLRDWSGQAMGQGLGSIAPVAGGAVVGGLGGGAVAGAPGIVAGAAFGAFGSSYMLNAGDAFTSSREDPDIAKALAAGTVTQEQVAKASALAGVVMAALDVYSLGEASALLRGPAKGFLGARLVKQALKGGIAEGTTEGVQQWVQDQVAAYLGANKTAMQRIGSMFEAAAQGALPGAVIGSVGGIRSAPAAATAPPGTVPNFDPFAGTPPAAPPVTPASPQIDAFSILGPNPTATPEVAPEAQTLLGTETAAAPVSADSANSATPTVADVADNGNKDLPPLTSAAASEVADRQTPAPAAPETSDATAIAATPTAIAVTPVPEPVSQPAPAIEAEQDRLQDTPLPRVPTVDDGAHLAATSPANDTPEPTEAQKKAGNYKMGRARVAGLNISIENPRGSVRSGTSPDGKAWESILHSHYGYIKKTIGADGDHVDVFLKPDTPEDWNGEAFIVDQIDPKTGKFDEHKILLGYQSSDEARDAYLANYQAGWKGMRTISAVPVAKLKTWLQGDTTQPYVKMPESAPTAPAQLSDATAKANRRAKQAAARRRNALRIDESKDNLFTAIAKLGGLNFDAVKSEWGHTWDNFKNLPKPVFGVPIVRKTGGHSIDKMGELLAEAGYLPVDEHGKYDFQDLEEAFDQQLSGNDQYAPAGWERVAAEQSEARALEQENSGVTHGEFEHAVENLPAASIDEAVTISDLLNRLPENERADILSDLGERAAMMTADDSQDAYDAALLQLVKEYVNAHASIEAASEQQAEGPRGEDVRGDPGTDEAARPEAESAASAAAGRQEVTDADAPEGAGAALAKHGVEGAGWIAGRGALGRGKWMASLGDASSNLHVTADAAAAELRQFLDAAQRGRESEQRWQETAAAVAGKVRNGQQPTDAEWAFLMGVRPDHRYARQAAAAPFLTQYLGVPKNNIRKSIGVAAGTLRSDSGAEYPIVYFRKLVEVFGGDKPALTLEGQSNAEVERDEKARKAAADVADADAKKAEKEAKDKREKQEIADRQRISAESFQLGQSAEDGLAGQGGIFDAPAPKAEPKAADKIEDFGEKLPPARRALAAKLDEELSDDDFAKRPFSQIWPAAENDAIEDTFAAAVAHTARELVPTKVRSPYKLKRWITLAKEMRKWAAMIVSGRVTRERFLELANTHSLRSFVSTVKLLEKLDRADWKRVGKAEEFPDAFNYEGDKQVPSPMAGVVVDGKHHWFPGSGDILAHLDGIKALLSKDEPEQRMQFEIRQRRVGGDVFIVKKGDKEYRRLMEFPTVEEARKAITEQYDGLVAAWEGIKNRDNVTERDLRADENRPRSGQDWRKGRDVTAEEFADVFGFRGGEFGKWVSQGKGAQERQFFLNSAYDALMDLADIVGVPPKAISLNGTLGIAFGSRGSGWASAHFESSNLVINLTKPRGAGALAHEWFHALDNYFSRSRGGEVPFTGDQGEYRRNNYVTYKPEPLMVRKDGRGKPMLKAELIRQRAANPTAKYLDADQWQPDPKHPAGVRPEVEERLVALVKTLNDSPMLQRSRMIDGKKSGEGYWSSVIERAARSFENYVMTRMMEQGYHNDFLANVRPVETVGKNADRYPYLLPDEIKPIADAFDGLFDVIETKDTEQGVAMFARSRNRHGQVAEADVEAIVARLRQELPGLPEVVIAENADDRKVPKSLRKQVEAVGGAEGTFHTDGKIYLFRDVIASLAAAEGVLAHETLHAALTSRFGAEKTTLLLSIRDGLKSVRMAAEVLRAKHRDMGEVEAIEEVLADYARTGKHPTVVQRFTNWLRSVLRKVGLGRLADTWTDGEIMALVADAPKVFKGANPRLRLYGNSRFSATAPIFFSKMAEFIAKKGSAGSPQEWKMRLKAWAAKGEFKADELQWSGLNEWLDTQSGKVTPDAVLGYLREGGVRVEEVELGSREPWRYRLDLLETRGRSNLSPDEREELTALQERFDAEGADATPESTLTKFGSYQLPGGERYRELLLTLPSKLEANFDSRIRTIDIDEGVRLLDDGQQVVLQYTNGPATGVVVPLSDRVSLTSNQSQYVADLHSGLAVLKAGWVAVDGTLAPPNVRRSESGFRSSHFDQPNIIAHVRFNDRTDAQGRRVLFLEEVQSDWSQTGRKQGFAGDMEPQISGNRVIQVKKSTGVPAAPFVGKTEAWTGLALKRMLRYAAENGYDAIAWTHGAQQAERYDLSKKVRRIDWQASSDGKQVSLELFDAAERLDGREQRPLDASPEDWIPVSKLSDWVGKEIAENIVSQINSGESDGSLEGADLRVGGEGMKSFYDQIIPNVANGIVKGMGARVGEVSIVGSETHDSEDGRRPGDEMTQPGIYLTDAMRETAMKGLPMFQRVWHGTPHRGISKFSTDKIGTGEGAQAYGWGLYFASRKEIAEHYRKMLSHDGTVRVDGKELPEQHGMFAAQICNIDVAMHDGATFDEAREQAVGDMQFRADYSRRNHYSEDEVEARAAWQALKNLKPDNWTTREGQLYEVEIPEDSEMLDWDKPLKDQPEGVRRVLEKSGVVVDGKYGEGFGASPMFPGGMTFSGEAIYRRVVEHYFEKQKAVTAAARKAGEREASLFLATLGIKGIRYLDGSSRNAGDGSHNYVVFDGEHTEIQGAMFSRTSQTDTPAFRKWFGKSAVVDADGRPLVVYHGTNADFAEFDKALRSGKTGNPNAMLGFFFTPRAQEASRYAKDWGSEGGAVAPVYLSIKNPYEMSFKEFDDLAMAAWRTIKDAPDVKFGDMAGQKAAAARLAEATRQAQEQAAARREELIAEGYDGIFVRMRSGDEYIAFEPTQIKSATGNSGAFDGSNPSILEDRSGYKTVVPPRQLAAAFKRWEKGEVDDAWMLVRLREEMGRRDERRDAEPKDRVRGADWIQERLTRARRTGELTAQEVEVALWMIQQNPQLANDLGISVRAGGEDSPSGDYGTLGRVMRLFTSKANDDTAAHELLHHTERMMPPSVQAGIRKEWLAQTRKAVEKAKAAIEASKASLDKQGQIDAASKMTLLDWFMEAAEKGDTEQAMTVYKTMYKMFDGEILPYQFAAASEFWAVNGSRLMRQRFEAQHSWVARARQWLREFIAKVRSAFGLASDAPILRGLQAVMNGDGTFQARSMISDLDRFNDLNRRDNPDTRLSRSGQAPGPAGKGGVAGVVAWAHGNAAARAVDWLDRKMDPIAGLPNARDYLAKRYETLGRIARVDDIAKGIKTIFYKAEPGDKAAVYEYLTTRDASPNGIASEVIRRKAVEVKGYIESVGDALVDRGLLSPESREEYRGAYLPRLYLKHLLSDNDWKLLGAGKKPSDMGYLKERKDLPEEYRKVILGEITDPAFLSGMAIAKPMRDMALLDFLGQISTNADWILPHSTMVRQGRKVSVHWAKEEAKRLRTQARHMEEPHASAAKKIADELDEKADALLGQMHGEHADYRQIPNTARYGRLRGLFVRREIYDDMMGVNDFLPTEPGFFQSVFGFGGVGSKITSMWKLGKVALNPPGQIRNFVSNAVMLQLSGVALHRVPGRVIEAWRQVATDGPYWQVAKKYGVTESTFTAQEIWRMKRDLLELEHANKTLQTWGKIKLIAARVTDLASDAYQFSEALFKTAKIIDEMKKGATASDAAMEAQKWLFDYSMVPKEVRYARSAPIGMPFLTYTWKVIPRLAEVAAKHPQRLIPWVALAYGLPMLVAGMLDVDDDDLEKLKKALPQWLQDRGHAYILPWKDGDGRWQVVDLGYFFPWTTVTEPMKDLASGEVGKTVKGVGLFGGPITSMLVAITTGKDSFTGRDIYQHGDPAKEQFLSIMNYLWSLAMPPIITEHGAVGKALRAESGETNKFGDPLSTGSQAALSAFGVNLYGIEAEHSRAMNMMALKREIDDTRMRMVRQLQNRGLSDEQRQSIQAEYTAEIQRRYQKLTDYLKESEIAPALRTGTK